MTKPLWGWSKCVDRQHEAECPVLSPGPSGHGAGTPPPLLQGTGGWAPQDDPSSLSNTCKWPETLPLEAQRTKPVEESYTVEGKKEDLLKTQQKSRKTSEGTNFFCSKDSNRGRKPAAAQNDRAGVKATASRDPMQLQCSRGVRRDHF